MSHLPWDGSDIGNLEPQIREILTGTKALRVIFRDHSQALLNRYDSSIPLIADELKPLFGLPKIGRHRCTYAGKLALLSRLDGEHVSITSKSDRASIQRAFVFRWVLGLTQNLDTALCQINKVSGPVVTSFREVKVAFDKTTPLGSSLTKTSIKKWFDSPEHPNQLIRELFGEVNPITLRFAIDTVIRRLDPKMVWWTSGILRRIYDRV